MKLIYTVVTVLILSLLFTPLSRAQLALERDINTEPASSEPDEFVEMGGMLYFRANDGIHGAELFRYNLFHGTAELAADVRSGDGSGIPTQITPFDGKIYFRGLDGIGTRAMLMVFDPADGSVGRVTGNNRQTVREPSELIVFNDLLFFSAEFTGAGREPGYYNPSTNEIALLTDINPAGNSSPSSFIEIDGALWFSANDGQSTSRLWRYDPASGHITNIIYDSPAGVFPTIQTMYHADGLIFFRGHVVGWGEEPFVYDIASNSLLDIPQLYPGPASSTPGSFIAHQSRIYFSARTQAHGRELMFFDPGDNSMGLLNDFNPHGNGNPSIMEGPDGKLYITANDGTTDERKLFSYNTSEGIKEVAVLRNDGFPNLLNPLISAGGKLFLYGKSPDAGTELFSYTPGESIIRLAADINRNTIGSFPYQFTTYNGRLYFGAEEPNYGREVWVYKPASGQVELLTNTPGNTSPYGFTVLNNKLFYAGVYPGLGYGLLYYNDQTDIISPTSFITPSHSGHISEIIAYQGKLFFSAFSDIYGNELFVYDPISDEASMLKDINPEGGSNPSDLYIFNNQLYFRADDGVSGAELWRYDHATGETQMVADINPGEDESGPSWFATYSGQLYFSAYTKEGSYDVYSYDPLSDTVIRRTQTNDNLLPEYLTVYNNRLFFKGRPSGGSNELMFYDAVTGELGEVTSLYSKGSNPTWLTVFNNKLYFAATNEAYGNELWEYGGAGMAIVADIRPGTPGSNPEWLTVFNNKLYFAADDGQKGAEIWSLAACLNLFVDTKPVTHIDSLGAISLSIEGGLPPYTISWDHGSNLQSPDSLMPGLYRVTVSDASGCLSELTVEVPYIDTTNTPEIKEEKMFTVFPNPNSGQFTMQWGDLHPESVSIYDMQGRVVLYETLDSQLQSVSIDLIHEKPGMYFMQIKSKEGLVFKKVLIQ